MKRAFTLIELMIVVAIIGVLAAIAVPNFLKFQCKAKTAEARTSLKALYVAEESFFAEADSYTVVAKTGKLTAAGAPSFVNNAIGFQPKGATIRYSYEAGSNNTLGPTSDFSSTASALTAVLGTGAARDDIWHGSQLNEVKQDALTENGCS
jgi:prepilin-type N-terminal cleavage/methylation domain-containing protein